MNITCPSATAPLASPSTPPAAQTRRTDWPRFHRFLRIARPMPVDFTQWIYTDPPNQGSSPRATLTHYR